MAIVTSGLFAYYHFSSFTGSVWNNIAPNAATGLSSTVVGATTQADGIYFDGVDDKVTVTGLDSTPTSFTIEMYYNPTLASLSRSLHFYKDATNGMQVTNYTSGGNIGFDIKVNSSTTTLYSGGHTANTWMHDVITYDSSVNKVAAYLNGTQKLVPTTPSLVPKLANTLYIGCLGGSSSFYKGKIALVRVYNRALSSTEVSQNYSEGYMNAGLTSTTPPTVTIVSIDRIAISDEVGANKANVTFKFDKDITEYTVRVGGNSYSTGINAQSAVGDVVANTEIVAEVDYTEMLQLGENRVNIYGKGVDGQWTPYE